MLAVKSRAILPVFLLLATSCTTAKLEELRQISPEGTPLQIALAREYLAFSDAEATQYDWVDSYYFADKGLKSAYGNTTLPENPTDWDISVDVLPELTGARQELMGILEDAAQVDKKPETAARAQYFYDCWVEQAEESWQEEDVNFCKEGFRSAIADLNSDAPAGEVSAKDIRTTAYMVFFNLDEWALTAEGHRVLEKVIADLSEYPDTKILLHGHADTSGSDDYNLSISERRAKAVQRKLMDGGVKEDDITFFAFGETDLRVPTADGIREPANRRVEIFLE